MLRHFLASTLVGGCFFTPYALAEHHHHDESATSEGIRFDAQFYVDAIAYERTHDLSVQDSLGIYNVHGGHDEAAGGHSHSGALDTGLSLNNAEAAFSVNAAVWCTTPTSPTRPQQRRGCIQRECTRVAGWPHESGHERRWDGA